MEALYGFVSRNRRRFMWAGGVIGGIYGAVKFAQYKFVEMEQERELERTAQANVKRRFEQNQQDCTFTILSLLPTLSEQILVELNVEGITARLQSTRAGTGASGTEEAIKRAKMELWGELKIQSFTRTIAAVYLVTLLSSFTHIQLNLLGRLFYLDSVVSFSQKGREKEVAVTTAKGVSVETERKYLTFSWFLLNRGWRACVERVKNAVELTVGSVPLKASISFDNLYEIVEGVRKKVELDEDGNRFDFSSFLMPPEGKEAEVLGEASADSSDQSPDVRIDAELKSLLDETRDFLESSDFQNVCGSCLDTCFALLTQLLRPQFFPDEEASGAGSPEAVSRLSVVDDNEAEAITAEAASRRAGKEFPLAGLLPPITRAVHTIMNGIPNLYVESLSNQADLKAFSVVVYTGWEN
ncbi:Peroxin-3 [Cladochytrium replicatum]|nr:Peroxin-3 [Cladochytrium replicatum]